MDKYQSAEWLAGIWGLDFARKIFEMSWFRRKLFQLVVGRYGFREFMGMCQALEKAYHDMHAGYGIEGTEYNKEKITWKDIKQYGELFDD